MPETLLAEDGQHCRDTVENTFDVDVDHILPNPRRAGRREEKLGNATVANEQRQVCRSGSQAKLTSSDRSSRRLTSVRAQVASPPASTMRAATRKYKATKAFHPDLPRQPWRRVRSQLDRSIRTTSSRRSFVLFIAVFRPRSNLIPFLFWQEPFLILIRKPRTDASSMSSL